MKNKNIFTSALPLPIAAICLSALIGNSSVMAVDNAALISVSVTNNQLVMPRTIFTQTWTVQNTGTTTWAPGASGYTLNMVGRDSLGAIELHTNTASHHYKPTAIIGGGHSVAPGQQATFSMSFIAPEAAGSFTDTFQLNSASSVFFGPMLTVQVTVQKAGSTNQYDRSRAVSFANNYAGYVVPDGYFWTNGSSYYFYGSNAPVPTTVIGDDCAHFVSCCIGRQAAEWGGGLPIPSRAGTYGEPGAGRLVNTVLIGGGYAKEVFSLNDMMPGDVVGWNWEGDTNIANLDHVTFYIGNGLLASHAASALDVSANTWYQSSESRAVRHLVHIFDAPTINFAEVVGNKMVFSWGTNWTGYVLQSSTSASPGATWTQVTPSPVKVGNLYRFTNSMSGVRFYRLVHP